MKWRPYSPCKGRKFKKKKLRKLIKNISCYKKSIINNYNLTEKNKIRFIQQFFRWFKKDSQYYSINFFLKKKYIISKLDTINITVKIQKAGWKKLLLKLNYCMKDYKKLKRRSYSLNFKFFFINNETNKEITLDIRGMGFDIFDIFITTNAAFFVDFYNIINTWIKAKIEKNEKDENDLILEDLYYIYSWHRANKVLCYDVYMPWYLSKEDYCMYRQFKKKFERKYFCTIRERKFSNSIFPIKKAIGHLIVSNKKKNDSKIIYWKTLFTSDNFKKKEDLFKELKYSINRINKKYSINSILVYFFIQLID